MNEGLDDSWPSSLCEFAPNGCAPGFARLHVAAAPPPSCRCVAAGCCSGVLAALRCCHSPGVHVCLLQCSLPTCPYPAAKNYDLVEASDPARWVVSCCECSGHCLVVLAAQLHVRLVMFVGAGAAASCAGPLPCQKMGGAAGCYWTRGSALGCRMP